MTHTILVVEDDPDIRELVAHRLEKESFVVHQAEDGQAAWDRLLKGRPDLMLVDVMMPRMDGEMLTMKVRKELKSTLPIIMVTAKGSEDDVVAGLLAGADDYVVKPFSMKELMARVQALLRRTAGSEPEKASMQSGIVTVFPDARRVLVGEEEIKLTATEYGLLRALLQHQDVVLSRGQLLDQVWGRDSEVFDRTVDVHMKNLRHKLGKKGDQVETVRGVGYVWRGKRN